MVDTYYVKLFCTGGDEHNDILMSLLVLATEKTILLYLLYYCIYNITILLNFSRTDIISFNKEAFFDFKNELLFPFAKWQTQFKRWSRFDLPFDGLVFLNDGLVFLNDGLVFLNAKGDIPICSPDLTFRCLSVSP